MGAVLLVWVLGTAYHLARRRGRHLGLAVVLVGLAIFVFAAAAIVPRPPMTDSLANVMVVMSALMLGGAMGVVLWRGFRD